MDEETRLLKNLRARERHDYMKKHEPEKYRKYLKDKSKYREDNTEKIMIYKEKWKKEHPEWREKQNRQARGIGTRVSLKEANAKLHQDILVNDMIDITKREPTDYDKFTKRTYLLGKKPEEITNSKEEMQKKFGMI